MDEQLNRILKSLSERLDRLEKWAPEGHEKMRKVADNVVGPTTYVTAANTIKIIFLAHIVRDAGLIDQVDVDAIAARVREQYSDGPLGIRRNETTRIIEALVRDLKGQPPLPDEDD